MLGFKLIHVSKKESLVMQGASVLAYLSEIIPVSAWQGFYSLKVKFNSLRSSDLYMSLQNNARVLVHTCSHTLFVRARVCAQDACLTVLPFLQPMSTTIYVYPSAWNTRMEMCHTCVGESVIRVRRHGLCVGLFTVLMMPFVLYSCTLSEMTK